MFPKNLEELNKLVNKIHDNMVDANIPPDEVRIIFEYGDDIVDEKVSSCDLSNIQVFESEDGSPPFLSIEIDLKDRG